MAQPLLANDRIVVSYTINGITHVIRHYVNRGTDVGFVHNLLLRDGVTQADWQDCIEQGWSLFRHVINTGANAAVAQLETLLGAVWNPVQTFTLTGVGDAASSDPASQYTLVLRDSLFKKIRFLIMEPGIGYVGHAVNGMIGDTNMDILVQDIDGNDAEALGYYQWVKSRGGRYLLGTGVVAGGTLDLNDKLKRARGLE